mgnify:CR=1 FL=1
MLPKYEQMIRDYFGEDADIDTIICSLFDCFKDMMDFLIFLGIKEDYLEWTLDRKTYKIKHWTKRQTKPIYPNEN